MTEKLEVATGADDILGCDDLEMRLIEVPEWKRSVYIRSLSAEEGAKLAEAMEGLSKEKRAESMFLLVAASIVTPDGKRMFSTPDELAKLRTRSQKVLLRIQDEIMTLGGWKDVGASKNA